MKYFRYYPWGLQFLLFLLMVITMLSFATLCISLALPKFAGIGFQELFSIDEHAPLSLIRLNTIVQGITSSAMFIVPSLLFAYFTHPEPFKYVGLRTPQKPLHLLLSVLLILGAMPMLEQIQAWVGLIDFGPSVKASQAHSEIVMKAFLTMPTLTDFMRTFLVMAIIPAVGEELFFRGILNRFMFKRTKNVWFSIVFTSGVFALIHSNIYGLLSIFTAGALLAGVYYLTSSLWCGILAHMCFNGTQVVLAYLAKSNVAVANFANSEHMPAGLLIGGMVVFGGALFLLIKTKTPLPANWTNDFEDEHQPEGNLTESEEEVN